MQTTIKLFHKESGSQLYIPMKYPMPVGLINYSTSRSVQSYEFKVVTQFGHMEIGTISIPKLYLLY